MENLEKYNQIFADTFNVLEDVLNDDFKKENVDGWDSVRQLSLTTAIEDEFDIMLDAEDMVDFTSYAKGKEILEKYDVVL